MPQSQHPDGLTASKPARAGKRSARLLILVGLLALPLSGCGGNNLFRSPNDTGRITTVTNPIDLYKLGCPSNTVKAIVSAIEVSVIKSEPYGPGRDDSYVRQRLQVECIGQESGRDVHLKVSWITPPTSPVPDSIFVGPDDSGNLAQLEASLRPGSFTPIGGVGDQAAAAVETQSGTRTVTLYVQRGATEFHISMQGSLPDIAMQGEERQIATLLLPQIPAASAGASSGPNVADFIGGGYAASLLTVDQLTAAIGRTALPLTANGGRLAYAPGIDVSNAYTNAKDGSERLDLQVYRAPAPAAALTFLTTLIELPKTTPNPDLAGLGDAAYLESVTGVLYVLSGREIVSLRVQGQGLSSGDSLRIAKALAAIVAPGLMH
jgi:hypothetical protein